MSDLMTRLYNRAGGLCGGHYEPKTEQEGKDGALMLEAHQEISALTAKLKAGEHLMLNKTKTIIKLNQEALATEIAMNGHRETNTKQTAQIDALRADVNLFDALLTEMLAIEIDGPIMSSLESLARRHDNANTLPTIVEIKEAISTAVVES